MVLLGGYTVVGALLDVSLVLFLVAAIVWLVSVISRGGRLGW